ncbi:uncharacterized protein LOC112347791 [Selaginella moellendorffii]|uniref:uncharacterized protein LOC112347791 n=1 Tax=Selaginella moellendorffii TaxID=88036 RepID=UPI000D1D0460|nr:uncharacterized protein LOC112347791 [Selaginella moellendorffii]|eukprot:XP_024534982.1 uncharacterized protein LOC112347791 [Selaginella moellendorffii]
MSRGSIPGADALGRRSRGRFQWARRESEALLDHPEETDRLRHRRSRSACAPRWWKSSFRAREGRNSSPRRRCGWISSSSCAAQRRRRSRRACRRRRCGDGDSWRRDDPCRRDEPRAWRMPIPGDCDRTRRHLPCSSAWRRIHPLETLLPPHFLNRERQIEQMLVLELRRGGCCCCHCERGIREQRVAAGRIAREREPEEAIPEAQVTGCLLLG